MGRISSSNVVVASGAWTSLFLRAWHLDPAVERPGDRRRNGTDARNSRGRRHRRTHRFPTEAGWRIYARIGGQPPTLCRAGRISPCGQLCQCPDGESLRHRLPASRAARVPGRLVDPVQMGRGQGKSVRTDAHSQSRSRSLCTRRHRPRVQGAFPAVQDSAAQGELAGMIDAMSDVVPIVDRAAAIPGLVIATGMSGHGFGIGPGMGRVVADLVQGNETGHNLHRFRQSRFSDGSSICLGPSL
ncbi:FAD-binding oxidoreductase [Mesorhizobium sp. M1399]|uniref:FAD-binding oxidoreductase n=1 Tax=Mesorhizobium sp. M1399 TaxID=2957096 RepID=UPI00333BA687